MEDVLPGWFTILMSGAVAALLGFLLLLCAMILDDRRDATARVVALRGGGDRED
jgi:hypothetical protein